MSRIILVVDDEPNNIEIIEGFLKLGHNSSHELIKCRNGQEAYEELVKFKDLIDLILLDRMMPIMSGIDFIHKVNEDPELKKIPIIMQTASNEPEHLLEGFRLGVYHYLVKPYSPTVLNSIVKSAIDFYTKQRELTAEVRNTKTLFKYVDKAIFKIRSIEDANLISVSLANLFPEPDKVVLGISEMLINAIEHGNLQISYDKKSELNMSCKWQDEIETRLNLPENKDKFVTISYLKSNDEIVLHIKDEGNGFDFNKYLEFDPERSTDNHGRGIAFANNLSFDRIEYLGNGNEVKCVIKN
ncbi:response regulator [Candidatus Berkiella aquae]|uniref:Response regulator n=1 Tax=Candidatus Berkiella aquae TaxID=295108 RepID=A0A0Q9YKL4_9GAMM|nr:response regulator [Candidatus Berkiella aquae]MCS5711180.1 response regulator [Candidatus Berkiella aquae]